MRLKRNWNLRWLKYLPLLLLFAELPGCKPKDTAYQVGETTKRYAKDLSSSAERLTIKTGESLGLVEKKFDYVRAAYESGEPPMPLKSEYTLEEEREIGRALTAELLKRYGHYENKEVDRYLNLLLAALCAYSDRPALPCSVAVLRSEEIRSFALPGGYVLVTLGALRLCDSESELAGLLAYNLAQIGLHCTLAQMEQLQPGAAISQLEDDKFSRAVESMSGKLIQDVLAAETGRVCDRAATDLLVRLGFEPGGLKAYLVRVQIQLREKRGGRPLENYAYYKEREQNIDKRLEELHAPTAGRTMNDRYRRECLALLPAP